MIVVDVCCGGGGLAFAQRTRLGFRAVAEVPTVGDVAEAGGPRERAGDLELLASEDAERFAGEHLDVGHSGHRDNDGVGALGHARVAGAGQLNCRDVGRVALVLVHVSDSSGDLGRAIDRGGNPVSAHDAGAVAEVPGEGEVVDVIGWREGGPEPRELTHAGCLVVPAVDANVEGRQTEGHVQQRIGGGLLEVGYATLHYLHLFLHPRQFPLHVERVFHLLRPVEQRQQGVLRGLQVAHAGLQVDVLVGHVLAVSDFVIDFECQITKRVDGVVQGVGRHPDGNAALVLQAVFGAYQPAAHILRYVRRCLNGGRNVFYHDAEVHCAHDDALLGHKRRDGPFARLLCRGGLHLGGGRGRGGRGAHVGRYHHGDRRGHGSGRGLLRRNGHRGRFRGRHRQLLGYHRRRAGDAGQSREAGAVQA